MIPWNETKWAMANARLGLKRDEICSGLTVEQHAESLAMWDCKDVGTSNKVWALLIPIIAKKIKTALMAGYVEEINESH